MVTRNFLNLLAMTLESNSTVFGSLPVVDVYGRTWYAGGTFSFPASRAETYSLAQGTGGVRFGTGNSAESEDSVDLDNMITSGISVSLTSRVPGCVSPGNPTLTYTFAITNTGSSDLTITEIGYAQSVSAASKPTLSSTNNPMVLLDRTVLETPLTLVSGDAGVLVYTLKTNPEPQKYVNGVKIVSFTWGSDEDVGAMIDAAQAGTIDLQTDGGWRVGQMRVIDLAAWTGGNSVAHAAEKNTIAISSFDEYMSCGNVMQFDFLDCPSGNQRMNATNTTVGGYGATEMYTTTLPAMVDALPSWLKTRLKTFGVLTSVGNGSSTIETVPNNKLALRSEIEIFNSTGYSKPGEGAQIPLYKTTAYRTKLTGLSGSTVSWWERSPNSSAYFAYVGYTGNASSNTASTAYGVAPFGCI